MSALLTDLGLVVTQVFTWVGTVSSTIVSTPLLLLTTGFLVLGGAVGIGVPEAGDDPVAAPTPQNFPQLPAAVDQQVPIVGAGVIGNTLRELFQMPCQSEQNCFTLLFHEDRDPGYTVFVVSVIVFHLSLYYTRKKRLCQYRFSYFIYHFPYILQRKYGKMR